MDKKQVVSIVKIVARFVVAAGASYVAKNAIAETTPENLNTVGKIMVGIGSYAVGGLVSNAAGDYTDKQVDKLVHELKIIVE